MEKSSFFNSVNGDRKYKAEDWAAFFSAFIGNGVFPLPPTNLQVFAGEGMSVVLRPGKGWINGYFYENTADLILSLENADGVLNRIDRIVIRWDLLARKIRARVESSEFSLSPVAPELQRDADAFGLCVADVLIKNGATSISQADITDQRLNIDLCGMVTSAAERDTIEDAINALKLEIYGSNPWPTSGPFALCKYKNRLEIKETQNWTCPAGVTEIDVFLVGGGAGGGGMGSGSAGGGGGSGFTKLVKKIKVNPGQQYLITIGNGGVSNADGGKTTAFSETANGGERGGSATTPEGGKGGDGGNGGGGGANSIGNGGNGGDNGSNGDNGIGTGSNSIGGAGGVGQGMSTIDPYTGIFYAGGGGGATINNGKSGMGGIGGGANGGRLSVVGGNGTAGTGGGGGGGAFNSAGGTGGSGIVIIYF